MQDIRYMLVHADPYTKGLTRSQATTIAALIHRTPSLAELKLSVKDTLGIYLQQAILTLYMLDMNPTNEKLLNYQKKIIHSFLKEENEDRYNSKNLEAERISPNIFKVVRSFIIQDTDFLTGSDLTTIQTTLLQNNQYVTLPSNFTFPYLNFRAHAVMSDEDRLNPLTLSVIYKKDQDYPDDLILSFYTRSFSSMQAPSSRASIKFFNGTSPNKTMDYIASMNYAGKTWREVIDIVQSCHFHCGTTIATESLANVLNYYIRGKEYKHNVNLTAQRRDLNNLFAAIIARGDEILDSTSIRTIADLYSFLQDDRVKYLLIKDPKVKDENKFLTFKDEEPFKSLATLGITLGTLSGQEAYAMADDSSNSTADSNPTANDSSNDDGEDSEEEGDNLFGDDGGFDVGEEDKEGEGEGDEEDNENGSQSSTDTTSSSSSSDESSSTTDSSATSTDTKAEDVNPIIEIIDDESFDEYLDRSILSIRLKRLISNPPTSLSSIDLRFLKHWYLQWFPCVSIATTREILGDLLTEPSKRLTSDD